MEQILYSLSDYKVLAIIAGFIIVSVETFIPVLPLVVIVVANVFILGMWLGFFVSWVGSSIASILLYFLANKFSKHNIFKKYNESEKVNKIITWIRKQGFTSMFVSYSCPFIPDFLITIASGLVQLDFKNFASGMIFGKFVMFLLISYVGEDVSSFLSSPIKIIVFSISIAISWIIGNKVNNRIHETYEKGKFK